MSNVSRGFRADLRQELPRWRAEGLVDARAADLLTERYQLAAPDPASPSLLAVYVLGAFLVGAGVISLVAWHWDDMSRSARLALIGAAMIAAHAVGEKLRSAGRHDRLGQAISLLGTLIFGANIALVAQIFQVSGAWYGIFGAFAVGALAAGLLLDGVPALVLATLSGLGIWAYGYADAYPAQGVAAAYALAAVALALVWRTRSRALLVVSAYGFAAALQGANTSAHSLFPVLVIAAILAAVPLVATGEAWSGLASVARVAGRLGFYAIAYTISFADTAREMRFRDGMSPIFLASTMPLAIAAVVLLAAGLRRREVDPLARGEAMLIAATVPAFFAGLSLETGVGAAIIANLALSFLALGRIVRGLSWLARGPFWEGIVLAGLLVTARFFEIESLLWLKGGAFIVCGAAVMGAGIAFERRLARKEVAHA